MRKDETFDVQPRVYGCTVLNDVIKESLQAWNTGIFLVAALMAQSCAHTVQWKPVIKASDVREIRKYSLSTLSCNFPV